MPARETRISAPADAMALAEQVSQLSDCEF